MGVLGASGYAGRELCSLLEKHPCFQLIFATANDQRGQCIQLRKRTVLLIGAEEAPLSDAALVFSALPHGSSKQWVHAACEAGTRVVDLSADLRPGNGTGSTPVPYGLTELARTRLHDAHVVANPGCYPTSILLALAPLVEQNLLAPGSAIVADSASGVTGAGNSPKRDLLFAELTEEHKAYSVGNGHRHLPEMRAVLGAMGADADLVFTPHLLPVARGILSTITVTLRERLSDVLVPWPSLRDVVYRNVVRISAHALAETRRPMLVVISAIDNLVKGAAGQAIQNGNVMFGLDERSGLPE